MVTFAAAQDIFGILNAVKHDNHPNLAQCNVALAFSDAKPFVKDRLNLGKIVRFNAVNKIWQHQKFDFCIIIPFDVWTDVLTADQRVALLDFHLCRISPKYIPKTEEVNGKKVVVKDESGRVEYTDEIKVDDNGDPEFQVLPQDMVTMSPNIKRYGLWIEDFSVIKKAIDEHNENLA